MTKPRTVSLAVATAVAALVAPVTAQDVSQPAILQWFEGRWQTIERRAPDVFAAGYGAVWTPPPGRAESSNSSVGYDVYDRFDLGSTANPTLYGTERSLKSMVRGTQQFGGRVYTDLVLNHNGFATRFTSGFNASGGYPGFVLTRADDIDGDFHQQNYNGSDPFLLRLSGLIDIAQEKNYPYIRNPVPGFAGNLPAGTTSFFGKLANVPNEANRRFYPDQQLGGVVYTDPTLPPGQQQVTMYNFNTATPSAGDPVLENAQTYLMRHARWMIQEVGVDGFRLDAVKHFPPAVLDEFDRYVYRAIPRPLLNGQVQHTFSFGEALDGNRSLVQQYIRKNINPNQPNVVGGNRDAMDFPLFYAMLNNLTSSTGNNNWNNVVNASQDVQDDGLANNGSQGVAFVRTHDAVGAPALEKVAHAYILMRPGNALVYFNSREFGPGRTFPEPGRDDALGGFFGDAITNLVNIRNTHGRGNYIPRVGETNLLAYEREKSAVVFLNNRVDSAFQTRTIQTAFAPGTMLVDLTGNATNPSIDPGNVMSDVVTVDSLGRVTLTVPGNANGSGTITDNGYVIYGLARPQGTITIPGVTQTLSDGTLTAGGYGTQRIARLDVITSDSFTLQLNTTAVTLPNGMRDRPADGDNALFRIDGGLDFNGNGQVDFTDPNGVVYGFEQFVTARDPGWDPNPSLSGNGFYAQTIDATRLSEGQHFITARIFRQRSDGGPAVFVDVKKSIYVDRLKPVSTVNSAVTLSGGTVQFRAQSTDGTADSVHFLLNQPGNQTEAQSLALVSGSNRGGAIDRDIFAFGYSPSTLRSGNQVITTVTFEPTGNVGVQRNPGVLVIIPGRGLGLGDTDGSNSYTTADVSGQQGVEFLTYPNFAGVTNHTFGLPGPAADLDGNGLLDTRDLLALRQHYIAVSAPSAVIAEARNAERRRGNINNSPTGAFGDAADIDFLFSRLGATTGSIWREDLNVDGAVTLADVDILLADILLTRRGDANLDGTVNIGDFSVLAGNFNQPGGWAQGSFDGDNAVGIADFSLLAANFNQSGPPASILSRAVVPEPVASVGVLMGWIAVSAGRRRGLASRR